MEHELNNDLENETKKNYPQKAYEEAKENLVYRLSELMFGSLLAAYVLGFVGFTASLVQSNDNIFSILPQAVSYLLISTTFAYTTASIYISYHTDLLTLPTFPLQRMRWDFIIAMLQGILFGFSMLFPWLFPFLFAIGLWLNILRKSAEFNSLLAVLANLVPVKLNVTKTIRYTGSIESDFKRNVKKVINAIKNNKKIGSNDNGRFPLKIWLPVSISIKSWTFVLTIIGILLIIINFSQFKNNYLIMGSNTILAVSVYIGVHISLLKKQWVVSADGLLELNSSFDELIQQLKSIYKDKR